MGERSLNSRLVQILSKALKFIWFAIILSVVILVIQYQEWEIFAGCSLILLPYIPHYYLIKPERFHVTSKQLKKSRIVILSLFLSIIIITPAVIGTLGKPYYDIQENDINENLSETQYSSLKQISENLNQTFYFPYWIHNTYSPEHIDTISNFITYYKELEPHSPQPFISINPEYRKINYTIFTMRLEEDYYINSSWIAANRSEDGVLVILWENYRWDDTHTLVQINDSTYMVQTTIEYNVNCGWLCGVYYGLEISMFYNDAFQLKNILYKTLYSYIS